MPDEKTRVAAEVLKALQKQQPTASPPKRSSLLTPPGEANYFEGEGLMETVQQPVRRQKMCSAPISQLPTPNTPAGLISIRFDLHHNCGDLSPSQSASRRLDKGHTKRGVTQLTSDGFEVHWQTDYQ